MLATGNTRTRGLVAALGRVAISHRRLIGVGWLAVLVLVLGGASAAGTSYSTSFSLPGTDSQRAIDLLSREFPAQSGDVDQIVFDARRGEIADRALRVRIQAMLSRVARLPHVSGVVGPYERAGQAISGDRRIAFASVAFDESSDSLPNAAVKRVMSVADAIRSPALQVELGGQAIENVEQPPFGVASAVGLLGAVAVLLITFGSLVAMGMPVVTALLGLGTGIGLIELSSHLVALPNLSTELAAMIGLGVGIDYALFVLTRFREAKTGGATVNEAVITAMDTAGRAVLFAGSTVIIALLGMFALGVSFLDGLALASALAVVAVMLASLTVLPALLSRFGARVARRRSRRHRRASIGAWERWAGLIQRHPWPAALAGLAIMLVIATPALSMRLGTSDAGNDPATQTTRRAYDLLAQGFGSGFNGPLQLVAQTPHPDDLAALRALASAVRHTRGVASVSPPRLSPRGTTAVINVYPRTSPQSQATTNLVERLRDQTLPPVEHATAARVLVGGSTAGGIDFTHVLARKLPLFIAVVVLLSALLLFVVFRSLVIPLQAAIMNLLSIGSSLGLIVAVFQWGWLGSVFGVNPGPVDSWLPVMLFAIVFGLSMDYEVFLVSRMHEEWARRRDPSAAVTTGLASTGRVITAAATIMVLVFLSFVLIHERTAQEFGLSLAGAVFLDAFVVRSLLLPAVLALIGAATWKLPHQLERRLPKIAIEPDPLQEPHPRAAWPAPQEAC